MSVFRFDGYFFDWLYMNYNASVWCDNYKLLLLIECSFDDYNIRTGLRLFNDIKLGALQI